MQFSRFVEYEDGHRERRSWSTQTRDIGFGVCVECRTLKMIYFESLAGGVSLRRETGVTTTSLRWMSMRMRKRDRETERRRESKMVWLVCGVYYVW